MTQICLARLLNCLQNQKEPNVTIPMVPLAQYQELLRKIQELTHQIGFLEGQLKEKSINLDKLEQEKLMLQNKIETKKSFWKRIFG